MRRPLWSPLAAASVAAFCAIAAVSPAARGTEIRDAVTGFHVDVAAAPGVCVIRPGAPLAPPCDGPEIAGVAASPVAQHPGTLAVVRVARPGSPTPWLLFVTASRGTFSASPTPENLETVVTAAAKTMRRADPGMRMRGASTSTRYDAIEPGGVHGARFVAQLDATGSSSTFVCLFLESAAYQLVLGSPRADEADAAAFVDGILATVGLDAPTAKLPRGPRPAAAPGPRRDGEADPSGGEDAAAQRHEATGRIVGGVAGGLCALGVAALLVRRLARARKA